MRDVKHPGPSLAVTSAGGQLSSRLFYITDSISGMQFLIDTGADISVIPPSPLERKHPQTLRLEAVNHTPIQTYGTRLLTLNLGMRHTFRWAFSRRRLETHYWRRFPAPLQPAGGHQTPSAPRCADATPHPRHCCTRLLTQPDPASP